ncbi:MAG: TolC family outer membrane protein [Gammaproteobacteria bacterium]|nr:TolC family outer membrane protein [Gammaproteobacteria bacterium]
MHKLIVILILCLSSAQLRAQDLVDIYRLALINDAELMIAVAVYQSELEFLPVATSARKPQIDFTVDGTLIEADQSNLPSNSITSYGYGLNLVQNLYNAEILASIDAAEANVARARADLEVSQQDLILRVAERYFAILAAQDNVEFAKAEETAIGRQLEQAEKRFEVGLIAITDVLEAQAQSDSAVSRTLLAENLLENSYQALLVIIAEPPSAALARLGDQLELKLPDPANIDQWVETSLQNNRSLISALAAQKVAEYVREGRSKANYPNIDLTASYTDRSVDTTLIDDFERDELRLMVQLDVPLFTGGRISAERQQAEANYRSAQSATLLQRRLTSQETRVAYLGVVFGISQVKALEQSLASSATALEATEAGFDVGTRTSIDVLISLRETFRAQRDYAGSRYEYLINILKLKQATGLLNLDDLEAINSWLR